ncbi:hypothetical protein ANCCEY_07032 [Ancylostoma ceylanicum]|uniref:Uncharacterized protein n=2 Tax=Ancylostoma ceylanicum TaxID=53326 RepID=A0A0D6LRR8_9BILA|nr:hypothetical protein ANCCEY_07032 [Ancylostoma ceylanicum]EYB98695.1 hypothetical protein Y032_0129g1506 [Ancylostoma ceylanicum]
MRLLLLVLAMIATAQAYLTFRGQSSSAEPRVVNIPVDANAMIQSSRFRPFLKRRFVLPGIGMPTYVREGDIPIRN